MTLMTCTLVLALMDATYFKLSGQVPALHRIWWLQVWVPFLGAPLAADLARLPRLSRRIGLGALAGALMALLHAVFNTAFNAMSSHHLPGSRSESFFLGTRPSKCCRIYSCSP